jgi:hypothetical protein
MLPNVAAFGDHHTTSTQAHSFGIRILTASRTRGREDRSDPTISFGPKREMIMDQTAHTDARTGPLPLVRSTSLDSGSSAGLARHKPRDRLDTNESGKILT